MKKQRRKKKPKSWEYLAPTGKVEAVPVTMLLRDYITSTRNSDPVPKVVADFMRHVAEMMLNGEDVRDLLALSRPNHRPAQHARRLEIAKECLQRDMNGEKLTDIYDDLAVKYGYEDIDSVKKIYEKWWFVTSLELGVDESDIPSKRRRIDRDVFQQQEVRAVKGKK